MYIGTHTACRRNGYEKDATGVFIRRQQFVIRTGHASHDRVLGAHGRPQLPQPAPSIPPPCIQGDLPGVLPAIHHYFFNSDLSGLRWQRRGAPVKAKDLGMALFIAVAFWLIVGMIFLMGCASPTTPSMEPVRQISAPAVRQPNPPPPPPGMIVCYTQPRYYCAADGSACWLEVDFYYAATCPLVPIE